MQIHSRVYGHYNIAKRGVNQFFAGAYRPLGGAFWKQKYSSYHLKYLRKEKKA